MKAKPDLALEAVLSPSPFAECGRPTGAVQSRGLTALISVFDALCVPGQHFHCDQRLRNRVSVYGEGFSSRLGVLDAARFPVNDVAFHPSSPVLALATGCYDGGYFWEGEMILWNWETDKIQRIFSENRTFTRVRFSSESTLAFLMRQRSDEEHPFEDPIAFGGSVSDLRPFQDLALERHQADPRLASFRQGNPASFGFDTDEIGTDEQAKRWAAGVGGHGFEERHGVWGVSWRGPDRLVNVHSCCHAEEWHLDGGRSFLIRGKGHGVQALRAGERTIVVTNLRGEDEVSTVWELEGEQLRALADFRHGIHAQADASGRILCRSTSRFAPGFFPKSTVILGDSREKQEFDFGTYDASRHHLRCDGEADLFGIREASAVRFQEHRGSVPDHELCRIDSSGKVRSSLLWQQDIQMVSCTARLLPDGTLARGLREYHPAGAGKCFIEAYSLEGKFRWRSPVAATPTALEPLPSTGLMAYALSDGRIGLIEWRTGTVVAEETVLLDGLNTMVLSLAAKDGKLAAGTIEGRILVFGVSGGRHPFGLA